MTSRCTGEDTQAGIEEGPRQRLFR
jgi:hypothetical protein